MWGCSVWSVCSTVCWLRMWRKVSGLVSWREHQTEVVAVLEHLLQEHHQLRLCQGGLQAGVVQDQWLHWSSSHTESSEQRQVRPGWWNIFKHLFSDMLIWLMQSIITSTMKLNHLNVNVEMYSELNLYMKWFLMTTRKSRVVQNYFSLISWETDDRKLWGDYSDLESYSEKRRCSRVFCH